MTKWIFVFTSHAVWLFPCVSGHVFFFSESHTPPVNFGVDFIILGTMLYRLEGPGNPGKELSRQVSPTKAQQCTLGSGPGQLSPNFLPGKRFHKVLYDQIGKFEAIMFP